jgi:hypothetical protein
VARRVISPPVNVLRSKPPVLRAEAADFVVASMGGDLVADTAGDPATDAAPDRPNPSRNDPESSVEIGAGRSGDIEEAMTEDPSGQKRGFLWWVILHGNLQQTGQNVRGFTGPPPTLARCG